MAVDASVRDFDSIAKGIVRDYVRCVLLIDNEWPEDDGGARAGAPEDTVVDPPEEVGQPSVEETEGDLADAPPPAAEDSKNLVALQKSVIEAGILFTGLRYGRERRALAVRLALRADIVVLDWQLLDSMDDGREALDILSEIDQRGGLRFVNIYTGHAVPEQVKAAILGRFSARASASESVAEFSAGSFVFSIRNKDLPGAVARTSLFPAAGGDLIDLAIGSIAKEYGGLVQLALLELAVRHREQLPNLLRSFERDIDSAVVMEANNPASPLSADANLRELLLDEWRSALEVALQKKTVEVISRDGVNAYVRSLASRVSPSVATEIRTRLGKIRKGLESWDVPLVQGAVNAWLASALQGATPSPKGASWSKDAVAKVQWEILHAVLHPGSDSSLPSLWNPLLSLDALFTQQFQMPTKMTQGTILRRGNGSYLICTTPLCDAAACDTKVKNLFSFARAEVRKYDALDPFSPAHGYFVIRSESDRSELFVLDMNIKPLVVLKVPDPAIELGKRCETLPWPACEEQATTVREWLVPVGQLRLDHALRLSARSASETSRVGVDRVEFFRTRWPEGL